MKKTVIIIAIILIGVIMSISDNGQAFAATTQSLGKDEIIKVHGMGEVIVEPDVSFVNFGVETKQSELAAAQNENARMIFSVMEALNALGISADNIQTSRFTIAPCYEYSNGVSKKTGYQVHNTVRVKLNDLASAGKLIDTVTAAGANVFYGIEFSLSDKSEHYHNALKKALEAAHEKARLIAESQGVKLGSLISVIEQTSNNAVLFEARAMSLADNSSASTAISAGKINVKAAVEVTYFFV